MNKVILALISAVFTTGAAVGAPPVPQDAQAAQVRQASQAKQDLSYYWWLHPKQGMVKVDRATNFPVIAQRQKQRG